MSEHAFSASHANLIEAAAVLGIHPMSARRLIKAGLLPAQQVFGAYLIDRVTLAQFKATYDPRPGRKRLRRLI